MAKKLNPSQQLNKFLGLISQKYGQEARDQIQKWIDDLVFFIDEELREVQDYISNLPYSIYTSNIYDAISRDIVEKCEDFIRFDFRALEFISWAQYNKLLDLIKEYLIYICDEHDQIEIIDLIVWEEFKFK